MSQRRIESVWAAIAHDETDDTEGLCAVKLGDQWMPLIAADPARLDFIREQARLLVPLVGKPIKIVHFTTREELEVLT